MNGDPIAQRSYLSITVQFRSIFGKTSDLVSIVQISHKEAATGKSQISCLSL